MCVGAADSVPFAAAACRSLLMVKPDNPVQFVIDYLRERYPDQVAAPHGGFDGGAELKYKGGESSGANPADEEEEDSGSESSDDEEDYVDELPQLATAAGLARRRGAVSAESGRDPAQLAQRASETAVPKVRSLACLPASAGQASAAAWL